VFVFDEWCAVDYDLTDLRLFVAMAEERNLTRGAARAFLAPSSASHRLRRLEDALQTPLFDRQPRGLEPTRAGEALLRHARQVFACIEPAVEGQHRPLLAENSFSWSVGGARPGWCWP
jgi:DNA-binding transcriptional LysR family regulator